MIRFSAGRLFRSLHLSLIGLGILLVAGCETFQGKALSGIDEGRPQHYSKLQGISRWQAEGKLALQIDGKRQSASFNWKQVKKNFVIHLHGPFGIGSIWLKKTRRGITFENAKLGLRHAKSPEQLLRITSGWEMPISALEHWIKGVPSPNLEITHLEQDDHGFITTLTQDGWQLQFSKPNRVKGWRLPGKLVARKDTVKVTMVPKKWTL